MNEIQTLEERKAHLVAEAGALLDKQESEDGLSDDEDTRYLEIEEALHNIQSMLKHVSAERAADEQPNTDAWDAVRAFAG